MVRSLRIEFENALYHLTSRGNAKQSIYINDDDRSIFLDILSRVVERFNWLCHAYCLMNNHYHLMVETPEANLSWGMRHLNGVYTQKFNRKHDGVSHLYQGRYKRLNGGRCQLVNLCEGPNALPKPISMLMGDVGAFGALRRVMGDVVNY